MASNANVTHEFINSLYIINGNLIDQRFLGKQADYTVFGHIPDNLGSFLKFNIQFSLPVNLKYLVTILKYLLK